MTDKDKLEDLFKEYVTDDNVSFEGILLLGMATFFKEPVELFTYGPSHTDEPPAQEIEGFSEYTRTKRWCWEDR